jgi:hypothetical protein
VVQGLNCRNKLKRNSRILPISELKMPKWFYGAAFSVLVAALLASAFVWYTARPSTYDECVVSEMRGQLPLMMYSVQKVCAVRFRKEDELPLSYLKEKIEVRMLPDFDKDSGVVLMGSEHFDDPPMVFTVIKNDTDYEITHARIKYSHNFEVDCSRISDEDWHDGPEFIFKNNVANVNMPGEYDEKTKLHRAPMCYQYVSLWGGAEETIIATIWFAATVRMTQAKFAGPVQL